MRQLYHETVAKIKANMLTTRTNNNNKQIFHAFLFNIRNYSPEVRNIQRREPELNIILARVNNFDIKQKPACNICFIIYPQHQTKFWVKANKAN